MKTTPFDAFSAFVPFAFVELHKGGGGGGSKKKTKNVSVAKPLLCVSSFTWGGSCSMEGQLVGIV